MQSHTARRPIPYAVLAAGLALFGGTELFWVLALVLTPLVTMRMISEEAKSGVLEFLLTAPVPEAAVVLGKSYELLRAGVALREKKQAGTQEKAFSGANAKGYSSAQAFSGGGESCCCNCMVRSPRWMTPVFSV